MAIFSFPEQVNERAARLVAGCVALLLAASLLLGKPWMVWPIALGFLLRVGWGPRFSPLARLAMAAAKRLWPVRPVSGPPKRFAQGIGALCTALAAALELAGMPLGAEALLALVILFASLEAALAFCMGCWSYARLQRLGWIAPDACETCAPLTE